jgi:hypothetical protein
MRKRDVPEERNVHGGIGYVRYLLFGGPTPALRLVRRSRVMTVHI